MSGFDDGDELSGSEDEIGVTVGCRPGRRLGKKKRMREARENWTSMWRDVVKRGKWKSRWSDENIHLLYWHTYQT